MPDLGDLGKPTCVLTCIGTINTGQQESRTHSLCLQCGDHEAVLLSGITGGQLYHRRAGDDRGGHDGHRDLAASGTMEQFDLTLWPR